MRAPNKIQNVILIMIVMIIILTFEVARNSNRLRIALTAIIMFVNIKKENIIMGKKSGLSHWAARTSGYQKLMLSLFLALCSYAATLLLDMSTFTRIIISWDVFAIAMITMMWILFFTTTAGEQREIVKRQDDDIRVIFAIILISVCISLFGALFLILSTNESIFEKDLRTIVTIAAITTSWILLHTIFTIRYAHLYHNPIAAVAENGVGGIDFPKTDSPDYIDFAYFSFVIGMTFQVSDITISSKTVRRYVLMHSLISFVFNTIIVALTVNTIAGIGK